MRNTERLEYLQNKTSIHQIQKVLILGLLHSRKISGYDIKKFLNNEMSIIAHPENRSVYYPLKKLISEKLVKKSIAQGETKLKKYLYNVTPKGKKVFKEMCKDVLLSKKKPFFDMDIPLFFLPFLNKKETIARLTIRKRFFSKVEKWLEGKEKAETKGYKKMFIQHQLRLLKAEDDFLKDIVKKLKNEDNL